MKKIVITFTLSIIVATIIILLNAVRGYRTNLYHCIEHAQHLQNELTIVRNNLFLPLIFNDFNLSELEKAYPSLQDKFILIFPEDICNICYEEVFHNIEKLENNVKNKIVAIISPKFERKFDIYNKIYGLNITQKSFLTKNMNVPSSLSNELIFFYSLNNEIIVPIILNSHNCNIKEYVERIHQTTNKTKFSN